MLRIHFVLIVRIPKNMHDIMKNKLVIPLVLLLFGSILLIVGANSYVNESSTALCSACGMKIIKSDPSTLVISASDGQSSYACCPVCADMVGVNLKDSTVSGNCINCGKPVSFQIVSGSLISTNPVEATMLSGGACAKNKLACSAACEAAIRTKNDWAAAVPSKTSTQVYEMAKTKLASMTITEKPTSLSTPVYAILGSGLLLVALAPVTWIYYGKRVD